MLDRQRLHLEGSCRSPAQPDALTHRPAPTAAGRRSDGADAVAVSPDVVSVYVGTFKSKRVVAILDRSRSSGRAEAEGRPGRGIVETAKLAHCRAGRALKGAEGLTVSPDGKKRLYGGSGRNAVAVLKAKPSHGPG